MTRAGQLTTAGLQYLARHAPGTLAWGIAFVFLIVCSLIFVRGTWRRFRQRFARPSRPRLLNPRASFGLR